MGEVLQKHDVLILHQMITSKVDSVEKVCDPLDTRIHKRVGGCCNGRAAAS